MVRKEGVQAAKVLCQVPRSARCRGWTVDGALLSKGEHLASCPLLPGTEPAADEMLVITWRARRRMEHSLPSIFRGSTSMGSTNHRLETSPQSYSAADVYALVT